MEDKIKDKISGITVDKLDFIKNLISFDYQEKVFLDKNYKEESKFFESVVENYRDNVIQFYSDMYDSSEKLYNDFDNNKNGLKNKLFGINPVVFCQGIRLLSSETPYYNFFFTDENHKNIDKEIKNLELFMKNNSDQKENITIKTLQQAQKFILDYMIIISEYFELKHPIKIYRGEDFMLNYEDKKRRRKIEKITTKGNIVKLFQNMLPATSIDPNTVKQYLPIDCCEFEFILPKGYKIFPFFIIDDYYKHKYKFFEDNKKQVKYITIGREISYSNMSYINEIELLPDIFRVVNCRMGDYKIEMTKIEDDKESIIYETNQIKIITLEPVTDKTNISKKGNKYYTNKNIKKKYLAGVEDELCSVFQVTQDVTFEKNPKTKNGKLKLYFDSNKEILKFEKGELFIQHHDHINHVIFK